MECNICFEILEKSESYKTVCQHFFCKSCINKWTCQNNTCPVCRQQLFKSSKELQIQRVQKMIAPYLNYVIEHPHLAIDPETLYSKFYVFFTCYMTTIEGSSNQSLYNFYFCNYKSYQNNLFYVNVDFLENNSIMPTEIWSILLNLLYSHSNSYEIYKCFNECLYFYCLKKGYTENQIQLLDRYKNDVHSALLF